MSRATLPAAGDQIEVATSDERSYTTWVDLSDDRYMRVFAPHDLLVEDLPGRGSVVEVRWHSARGRHHVDAVFVERIGDGGLQWVLEVEGDLRIVQDRQFVRGAGGEALTLERLVPAPSPGAPDDAAATEGSRPPAEVVAGVVVDLSERGVRARCARLDVETDDEVSVVVTIDTTPVAVAGTVLRVFPGERDIAPEVVVVFEPDEPTATLLRRYVLQAQLRARRTAAD